MRSACDFRTGSTDSYNDFCKKNPNIKLTQDQWRAIIYGFNESFRNYILETGEKIKMPGGLGYFSISKKKRKRIVIDKKTGKEHINLSIDWVKTLQKGKKIYNFNNHTEGYCFWWQWFRPHNTIKHAVLWRFKASRVSSRMLAHYIKTDNKYQHLYKQWIIK